MPFQHNAPRPTKRLAVATRVSTVDQEEYGTSLDDQIAKGRLYAQLHDFSVDDRPYEQGGSIYCGDESGTLPLAHRTIARGAMPTNEYAAHVAPPTTDSSKNECSLAPSAL